MRRFKDKRKIENISCSDKAKLFVKKKKNMIYITLASKVGLYAVMYTRIYFRGGLFGADHKFVKRFAFHALEPINFLFNLCYR